MIPHCKATGCRQNAVKICPDGKGTGGYKNWCAYHGPVVLARITEILAECCVKHKTTLIEVRARWSENNKARIKAAREFAWRARTETIASWRDIGDALHRDYSTACELYRKYKGMK